MVKQSGAGVLKPKVKVCALSRRNRNLKATSVLTWFPRMVVSASRAIAIGPAAMKQLNTPLVFSFLSAALACLQITGSAFAHTNSLGYIITSGTDAGTNNVRIVYGSYHSGVIAAEGSLALRKNGVLIDTRPFSILLGDVADGVVPAGLVAGENYFWVNGAQTSNTPEAVYNFQSVIFDNLTAGTYVAGYANTGGLSQNWEPNGSIVQNLSFYLTSGGRVFLPGITTDIDTVETEYLASSLGRFTNPNFVGGTLRLDEDQATYSLNFSVDGSANNTIDASGLTSTFSGVFANKASEAGRLNFTDTSGNGKIVLTGNNNYTGGTFIQSAIVQVGNGGTSGSISGDIVNDGTLVFNRSNVHTFDNEISGAGSLIQAGSGTLTLAGNNSYTGLTTISSGTLRIGAGGTSGSVSGDIVNNGTLVIDRNNTYTFTHEISGSGSLTHAGSGTLILSGENALSGVTTVLAGRLQIGAGGNNGSISGNIINDGVVSFNRSDQVVFSKNIGGTGSIVQGGSGTLILSGDNSYTGGTTINSGKIAVTGNNNLGTAAGRLTLDGGTLQTTEGFELTRELTLGTSGGTIDTSNGELTLSEIVSGSGALQKVGSGKLVLSNTASHSGGTTVSAGTLQIGAGDIEGSILGNIDVAGNATLEFNHANIEDFAGKLSGTGTLKVDSPGGLTLSGDNSGFTGSALVNGTTTVNGNLGASAITVSATGELAGRGHIAGDTTIASGGRLIGTQGKVLSFDKDLSLAVGSNIDVALGVESTQALFDVAGDLTLKGTINVSSLGGFGGGTYRIFDYGGQLVNASTVTGDVSFGTLPGGMDANHLTLLTSVNHEVSFLNSEGIDVNFWDGANPGGGSIGGGSGVWNTSSSSWTDATGNATNLWNDEYFAIFSGTAGTVTIDNVGGQIRADGLQFSADGYQLTGGPLELGNGGADRAVARVGDGTVAGAAITATIASELQGTQGLLKTDYGTLILTGENSYTGGTGIQNGILQIGDGGTGGSVQGDIVVGINDSDAAKLVYKHSNNHLVSSAISGSGTLEQAGSGVLTLTGENSYSGGTLITSGAIQIGNGGAIGSIVGEVAIADSSQLIINRTGTITLEDDISGGGQLVHKGTGQTLLSGDNTFSGGMTISAGSVSVANNGNLGAATGDLTLDGGRLVMTESFDNVRAVSLGSNGGILEAVSGNTNSFAGVISGGGSLTKDGAGLVILSGDNGYAGGTMVAAGILQIGNGDTTGSVTGDIVNNGIIAFDRSNDASVSGAISGTGSVAQQGNGTLTLAGDNSYAGGTTINAGSVLVANNGNLGAVSGGLTLDGGSLVMTESFDNARTVSLGSNGGILEAVSGSTNSFAGVISGVGSLTKDGAGTIVLSGDNSYTGGTAINAGALSIVSNGNLGAVSGGLTLDGGSLVMTESFDNARTVSLGSNGGILEAVSGSTNSFAGVISDVGSLTKDGAGTVILSGDNTYAGGTVIRAGSVSVVNNGNLGAAAGYLALDGGRLVMTESFDNARIVNLGSNGGTLESVSGMTNNFFGTISGTGTLVKMGEGDLVLSGNNSYAGGTTITAGSVSVANNGNLGAASGGLTLDGGRLVMTASFNNARSVVLGANGGTIEANSDRSNRFSGAISGGGRLTKDGPGILILSGDNSYAGGTTIGAGTLQIGNGGTTGSVTGDIVNNGDLVFNHSSIETYAGQLSGTGSLTVNSPGGLTMTGNSSSFTGVTTVDGTLVVDGVLGSETIDVTANGELGGSGRIMGNVGVSDGGRLVGFEGRTQTFEKNLSLSSGTLIDVSLGILSGGITDPLLNGSSNTQALFDVASDLTLKGTINVSSLGGFGVGTYRLFDYGGLLNYTEGDVIFGDRPDGVAADDLSLRTSVAHQVTLLSRGGQSLGFWDGGNAANADNGVVNGGDGVWNNTAAAWTDVNGLVNDHWIPAGFAVFEGVAGTVTVDNSQGLVSAAGMQFSVDDYVINGDSLNLAPKDTDGNVTPVVRVGDGTAEGATITATIASEITGTHGLEKTDLGKLILTADNGYTGGTAISQGVIQLGNGGTSGSVTGDIVIGTSNIHETALVVDRSGVLALDQTLSGSGKLVQQGSGVIVLSADNSYMGGTDILNGVVEISKDANLGGGEVRIDGGVLRFDADAALSSSRAVVLGTNSGAIDTQGHTDLIAGLITGDGKLTKEGSGTLIISADNGYTGGTAINAGTLQLGNGGTTGSVEGDVAIAQGATLAINRSDQSVIDDVISGAGGLSQKGSGVTVLSADNNYEGGTAITGGVLEVSSDRNLGASTGGIAIDGGILRFTDGFESARDVVIGEGNGGINTLGNTNKITSTVSGVGGLIKDGSGTLILTGENTYAGGSRVGNGILQIGDGGASGSIKGPVELTSTDSELVIDLAKNITLESEISGSGALSQQGSGITTITAAATYTGNTKITNGELHLVGEGSIANSAKVGVDGVLDAAGTNGTSVDLQSIDGNDKGIIKIGNKDLNITDAKDGIFAGTIAGTGGVDLKNGTQRFSGENTYTGGTQIASEGTLIIGDGGIKGSVAGAINVDGKLIYDRSDRFTINPLTGDGDLALDGNGTGVINSRQGLTGEIVINNGNQLVLEGDGDVSAASGVTSNGMFDISGSDQSDIRIGHLRGENVGRVALGDKNLVITNGDGSEFAGGINGKGGFIAEKGKQILSGDNSYTGDTLIMPNGELQLGNENRASSLTSKMIVEGILSGNGSMNDLHNRGVVSTGTDTQFGTLVAKGSYVSEGGRLVLHTELNGDNSKGDRLVVAGNTSGTTSVTVINRGGLGEQTVGGIRIIEVDGQSDGVFNLNGDYANYRGAQAVVAGAYAYTLEKSGVNTADGNWYLRSERKDKQAEPEYQAGVSVYSSAVSALARLNRGSFAEFGSRMNGGAADGGKQKSDADNSVLRERYFWGRVLGGYSFSTLNGSATGSTYGSHDWTLQAGLDGQFIDNAAGSLFGNVWVDYSHSNVRTRSEFGNGNVSVTGYGLGSGLTWSSRNGFYLDGQGKVNWYSSGMDSDIINEAVANGVKSFGYALSLEAGQRFSFNQRWSITPQAQLIWSSLNTGDYVDVFNANVSIPDNRILTARIGLGAGYDNNWMDTNGAASRLNVGGIVNLYQDLERGADYVTISGTRVATGVLDKTWGELGLTANYSWDNDAYSIYAKTSLAASFQNFADSYAVSGNVGFRVKW